MSADITIDKEVFKALAGETRVQLLKSLVARRKTQSELAKELGLSAPTVKEHTTILVNAGLVREMDDGHKWKYIELTLKGKSLLNPEDSRILVLLGTSLLGVGGSIYLLWNRFTEMVVPETIMAAKMFAVENAPTIAGAGATNDAVAETTLAVTADTAAQLPVPVQSIFPAIPWGEVFVLVACLTMFLFALSIVIKKTK